LNFLAIDFETANYKRSSACSVGLVKVKNNKIIERASFLIKPPEKSFVFTYIHGLTWDDVSNEPSFGELWPEFSRMFKNVDCLVAHNASFDKSVLRACCEHYGIKVPEIPFKCTMKLSRELWNIHPTTLDNVCRIFNIPLKHHDAASDTEACARIMMRAMKKLP